MNAFPAIPNIRGNQTPDIKAIIQTLNLLTGSIKSDFKAALDSEFRLDGGKLYYQDTLVSSGGGALSAQVPTIPQNATLSVAFTAFVLGWDAPTYNGHAYTEIWRSEVNLFAGAARIATTITNIYADEVGYNKTYFYWLRHVNIDSVEGPIHATSGLTGTTVVNVTELMQQQSALIDESLLAQALRDNIDYLVGQWSVNTSVNGVTGGAGFYNDGTTTYFLINSDVFALLNRNDNSLVNPFFVVGNDTFIDSALIQSASIVDAQIQNLGVQKIVGLDANFLFATIGLANIGSAYFTDITASDNFITGSQGALINWRNGYAEFQNIFARGNIQATSLNAATGTYSGTLTANAIDAVTTINIAGKAVVIDESAFSRTRVDQGTVTGISNYPSTLQEYKNAFLSPLSKSIDMTGARAGNSIKISGSCYMRVRYLPPVDQAPQTGRVSLAMVVYRSDNIFWASYVYPAPYTEVIGSGQPSTHSNQMFFEAIDQDVPSQNLTYTIIFGALSEDGSLGDSGSDVFDRSLALSGVKV